MKSFKKWSVLVLLVALSLIMTACGGEDASSQDNEGASDGGNGSDDAVHFDEISIMAPTFETTAPPADNEIEVALEELTGKKISVNWVPNVSYEDRMNVTLASNEIPHVMVIQGKTPGFLNSAEAGAFWELSDYIDDYENLAQYNPDVLRNSSVNGNVYGIYRERDIMRSTAVIRRDWLENLGLDVPETLDDLYDVLHAFTYDDPNQSGQDDTVGLIIPTWYGSLDTLAIWFGAPNKWGVEDGEIIPDFATDEYKESLAFAKRIVDEGLVNNDFTTLSPDDWNSEMFNGNGGMIIDTYSRAMQINNLFRDDAGTDDPEDYFVEITGTIKSDGQEFGQPTDGYSGFLAISKSSVQTEEELHEVLSFLDTLNTPDAINLMSHGIESVNYELDEDGYLTAIDSAEAEELMPYVRSFSQINTYGEGLHKMRPEGPLAEKRYHLMEENETNAVFNEAAHLVSDVYTRQGNQLDDIIADSRILYIAGQLTEEEFEAEIDRWYSSGGQELLDELNELYAQQK